MQYDKRQIAEKLVRWEAFMNDFRLPAWEELPKIELYMDQIIGLVTQYVGFFVYDPDEAFRLKVNPETVLWQRIAHPHWESVLRRLVEEHVAETKSPLGARLLNDWDREIDRFWQVVPKEMLSRLPVPLGEEEAKRA